MLTNDAVVASLESLFEQDHDPTRALVSLFLDALLQCTSRSPELRLARVRTEARDAGSDRLPALSLAEKCVLVACKRTANKCPDEPVTFDALFDEYALGFGTSAKVQDGALLGARFSRPVMRAAVDGLLAKGVLHQGEPDGHRPRTSFTTVDTRGEIHCKWPLSVVPELLLRTADGGASDTLIKLAAEVL